MTTLRKKLIRLAYHRPELRPTLLPLLGRQKDAYILLRQSEMADELADVLLGSCRKNKDALVKAILDSGMMYSLWPPSPTMARVGPLTTPPAAKAGTPTWGIVGASGRNAMLLYLLINVLMPLVALLMPSATNRSNPRKIDLIASAPCLNGDVMILARSDDAR